MKNTGLNQIIYDQIEQLDMSPVKFALLHINRDDIHRTQLLHEGQKRSRVPARDLTEYRAIIST